MTIDFTGAVKTEAEVLADVVRRNDAAVVELEVAINGTTDLDEDPKEFAVHSLVRKLSKALGPIGYEVRKAAKPKATGAGRPGRKPKGAGA